jgi:hypothetical protein
MQTKYAKTKKTDTQRQHMINDRHKDTKRRETNLQTQKIKGGCKDEKNKHAKMIDNKQ